MSFTAHNPCILDDELTDVAETKKLQADAGPTTLPVYASEAHELSHTHEPIAGPSAVGTKAPGHQQPENFDIMTPGCPQPENFDVKTPGRQQPEDFDVDEFLALLDDYSEAGFNKAPGCPQPEPEDFDVDESVALLNDYGKGIACFHDSAECAKYIDGLVQDCSNSSALAMELLQSCTKSSVSLFWLKYSMRVAIHPSINLFILSIYESIHH